MKPSTKLANNIITTLNLKYNFDIGFKDESSAKTMQKELAKLIEEVYPPEAKPVVVPMAGRTRSAKPATKATPVKARKVEAKKAKPLQKKAAKPAIAEKRRGRPAKVAK